MGPIGHTTGQCLQLSGVGKCDKADCAACRSASCDWRYTKVKEEERHCPALEAGMYRQAKSAIRGRLECPGSPMPGA